MYMYILSALEVLAMALTKLFKNGNSQAVRIRAEPAYISRDIEFVGHPRACVRRVR